MGGLLVSSDTDCVVGGDITRLARLHKEFKDVGFKCLHLDVPHAYHTCAMDPILDRLRQLGAKVKLGVPSIPILSNVHGRIVSPGDSSVFTPDYFARQCAEPVRFAQGIQDLTAREVSPIAAWLDIGPHPTTLPMIPESSQHSAHIACLRKAVPDLDALACALTRLYSTSIPLAWRKVFVTISPEATLCEIPAYPFANTRYWVPYREAAVRTSQPRAEVPRFSLLDSCGPQAFPDGRDIAVFETDDLTLSHLITGHRMAGYALCPASVYLELALSASHVFLERLGSMGSKVVVLSGIVFTSPLVYNPAVRRTVLVNTALDGGGEESCCGTFSICSTLSTSPGENQTHCHGSFRLRPTEDALAKLSLSKTTVERRKEAVCLPSGNSEVFRAHTVYNVIFPRVVEYSKPYHIIQSIWIDPNGVDAYAHVKLDSNAPSGCFVTHPIFVDSLLHVAGFLVNCNAAPHEVFICNQIDAVHIVPARIDESAVYGVYCNIGFLSETLAVADTFAVSLDGTVVAHMKRLRFRKLKMSVFESVLSATTRSLDGTHTSHFRQSSGQSAVSSAISMPDRENLLLVAVSEVCGIDARDLRAQSRLSDLGVDSLMSIELVTRLRGLMPGIRLDTHKILSSLDIQDLLLNLQDDVESPVSNASFSSGTLNDTSEHSWSDVHPPASLDLFALKEVVSSVLNIPTQELSDDADLRSLGLDSLTAIEALHALKSRLGVALTNDMFMKWNTIRDIHSNIFAPSSPKSLQHRQSIPQMTGSFASDSNPTQYQQGRDLSALPLFLIHDGSGMAHSYSRIALLGRSVWGIHNPKFSTGEKWDGGVVEMAVHYASMIKDISGNESCIIGGQSFVVS